jgi:hypothetical protein
MYAPPMLDLGSWSFGSVVLASVLWVALVLGAAAASFYLLIRYQASSTGSGGIGAVSVAPNALDVVATLFGPPILLILAWLYRRRRK